MKQYNLRIMWKVIHNLISSKLTKYHNTCCFGVSLRLPIWFAAVMVSTTFLPLPNSSHILKFKVVLQTLLSVLKQFQIDTHFKYSKDSLKQVNWRWLAQIPGTVDKKDTKASYKSKKCPEIMGTTWKKLIVCDFL